MSEIEICTLKWLQNEICNQNLLPQGFHPCKIKHYGVARLGANETVCMYIPYVLSMCDILFTFFPQDFLQTMAVNTGLELNNLKILDNFQLWNTYDTLHCEVIIRQERSGKIITPKLDFN